jgi:hypothetical protein
MEIEDYFSRKIHILIIEKTEDSWQLRSSSANYLPAYCLRHPSANYKGSLSPARSMQTFRLSPILVIIVVVTITEVFCLQTSHFGSEFLLIKGARGRM